jgi:hypothetical protein
VGKAKRFAPGGSAPEPIGVQPHLLRDDRVLWEWTTREKTAVGEVDRRWVATSAPRAGRIGRPIQVAKRVVVDESQIEPSPVTAAVLTNAQGGQVAYAGSPDNVEAERLYIWTRQPGRPFGSARSLPLGEDPVMGGAMNGAGDAVIVIRAGDAVQAMVGRGGRFGDLQRLGPAGDASNHGSHQAAVDGLGRAVVVWHGWEDGDRGIHAAAATRSGRFGPATVIAQSDRERYERPHVAVNARGQATVTWVPATYHERLDPRAFVVRGRLGG